MRTFVFVLLVAVLTGCSLNTDYFGEYRGVNLLSNYHFDALKADGVTPQWGLATSTSFMTWQSVVDTDRPTEPVYRLEILNLIPNGDFQNTAVTNDGQTTLPTVWSTTNFDGTTVTDSTQFSTNPTNVPVGGTINGSRALGWAASIPGHQLRLDLSGTVPVAAWKAIDYLFEVDLRNAGSPPSVGMFLYTTATGNTIPPNQLYNKGDWTQETLTSAQTTDNTTVYRIVRPFGLTAVTDTRAVAFGPNSSTALDSAVIDNVRLVPRSEKLASFATFDTLEAGAKPLLPGSKDGMYIFTVDVKNDPQAGTLNHFAPTFLSVTLEAAVKSGSRNRLFTIAVPSGGWSVWTTLTFSFGFDFVNSDADLGGQPALKISLSPTVSTQGDADVGTILVSRPTLTFNP